MKSPSRAGALARTSSTGSDGRTTSSRRMFSSSIVWAVGGMSSVGQLGEDRVLVEDVVELALEPAQLLVAQPEASEMGDVLDVGARQGGHGPMIAGMRIIFARHGESEANVARVIANRSMGFRLTGRGHAQARALADALLASGTQAGLPGRSSAASLPIRSSPLLRARETADILGRVLGRPVIVDEALREADCGVMEGRSDEEAWAAHHALQLRWAVGETSARIEGGESMDDVIARFVPFVAGLMARATADDDVICVGHGSLFRCGLPAILQTADGAPFTPRDIGEAEALVATLGASGQLIADSRMLPARDPHAAHKSGATG